MGLRFHEWPGTEGLVFTRDALREIDRRASEEFGVPSIVLMENAAAGLARVVARLAQERSATGYVVLAGSGNNGGDGLAMLRHLWDDRPACAVLVGKAPSGDPAVHLRVARAMGVPVLEGPDGATLDVAIERAGGRPVCVDAILGTGLRGAAEGSAARAIDAVQGRAERWAAVIAADVPSGMDVDAGEPAGVCVRATATVSFVGMKAGFFAPAAAAWLGEVFCVPIGAPPALVRALGVRRAAR